MTEGCGKKRKQGRMDGGYKVFNIEDEKIRRDG
jgi:hypothetical protein